MRFFRPANAIGLILATTLFTFTSAAVLDRREVTCGPGEQLCVSSDNAQFCCPGQYSCGTLLNQCFITPVTTTTNIPSSPTATNPATTTTPAAEPADSKNDLLSKIKEFFKPNVIIIFASVGGALLVLIILACWCCHRRRKQGRLMLAAYENPERKPYESIIFEPGKAPIIVPKSPEARPALQKELDVPPIDDLPPPSAMPAANGSQSQLSPQPRYFDLYSPDSPAFQMTPQSPAGPLDRNGTGHSHNELYFPNANQQFQNSHPGVAPPEPPYSPSRQYPRPQPQHDEMWDYPADLRDAEPYHHPHPQRQSSQQPLPQLQLQQPYDEMREQEYPGLQQKLSDRANQDHGFLTEPDMMRVRDSYAGSDIYASYRESRAASVIPAGAYNPGGVDPATLIPAVPAVPESQPSNTTTTTETDTNTPHDHHPPHINVPEPAYYRNDAPLQSPHAFSDSPSTPRTPGSPWGSSRPLTPGSPSRPPRGPEVYLPAELGSGSTNSPHAM